MFINISTVIKIFEVDIRKTSDEKLVCVHGWSKKDYQERLGLEYIEENAKELLKNIDLVGTDYIKIKD